MLTTPCPSPEDLRLYALGECEEPAGRRIEEHLNRCPACEETLAEFDSADDTLLRHLPLVASADPEPSAGWLDRLRGLPHQGNVKEAEVSESGQQTPGDFLGAYRLLACIGRGGMGVVYGAIHNQLDRVVALKVLSPHLVASAAARARFDREIQIVGKLEHPGIVRASDAGREGRVAYLVMEYIDGVDLARLVRRGGPLTAAEACEAARQIAEALAAAHAIGAVHRDVKPSNVMIDRAGRVKLLDFGLAHLSAEAAADRETTLGRLLGTLDYLAPEQAEGEPLDYRADLYGLGATLFFLLTGRPPHGYSNERPLLAQLRRIAENDPLPLSSIRPDIPAELNELVARLLARRPEDRPSAAAEVAAQLTAFAGGDLAPRVSEVAPPQSDVRISSPEQMAAAEASLAELLGEEHVNKPRKYDRLTATQRGARRRARRRFAAAVATIAVLLAASWLGVVLLLQTSQGTIRIESEADDVRVELLADGKEAQSLEINEGANETTLRAGRYRIRLAGGHDALEITPEAFTLRHGEKVVAKIRYEKPAAPALAKIAQDEPLYRGEPRSVWQDRYERERDSTAKQEAAQALTALAQSRPIEEQADLWIRIGSESQPFKVSPQLEAFQAISRGSKVIPNGVGMEVINPLHRATRESWAELAPALVAHFVNDNTPRYELAAALLAFAGDAARSPKDPEGAPLAVDRLLQVPRDDDERWLASRLLAARLAPSDPRATGWLHETSDAIKETKEIWQLAAMDAWLTLAANVPVPTDEILRVISDRVMVNPDTLQFFASTTWRGPLMKLDDARAAELRRLWPETAAELINHLETTETPQNFPAIVGALFTSIDKVLEQFPADSGPSLEKTREVLDQHLRVRYVVEGVSPLESAIPPEVTQSLPTNVLLRNYWRIAGEIPDYVHNGEPADKEIRAQLESIEKRGLPHPGSNIGLELLLSQAPYHTVRSILFSPDVVNGAWQLRNVQRPDPASPQFHVEHWITKVIADECGESADRDSIFGQHLTELERSKGLVVEGETLDSLRLAEAIREIIRMCLDDKLLSQAVEAAQKSPHLREEVDELLAARINENRLTSANEAALYLRTVEGRWKTEAGRKAVAKLEEAIRAAPPDRKNGPPRGQRTENLAPYYLATLDSLEDYDLSWAAPILKTWTSDLRGSLELSLSRSRPESRLLTMLRQLRDASQESPPE